MTIPADHNYPTTATDAAWQKKKSVADKAMSKTGLGADLKDAEKKWNAIPWHELDAAGLHAASSVQAKGQLATAKTAIATQVQAAKTAVTKAKGGALAAAGTKGLSGAAKTAATAIANDLTAALTRLQSIKTTDFEAEIVRLEKTEIVQLTKITIQIANKQVGTASSGDWDRHELKATGVVWSVGKAADYTGKAVKVFGETSHPGEGQPAKFQNDMKVEAAAGSTATFKP